MKAIRLRKMPCNIFGIYKLEFFNFDYFQNFENYNLEKINLNLQFLGILKIR